MNFIIELQTKEHYLHYFVDFTERDFVQTLQKEINDGKLESQTPSKIDDTLLSEIYNFEKSKEINMKV